MALDRRVAFFVIGSLVTLISNSFLLLLLEVVPVNIATLCSHVLHGILGYKGSKYGVFRRVGNPVHYALLFFISWFLQWRILAFLIDYGISKPISVLALIPIFATLSFLAQKHIIFRSY